MYSFTRVLMGPKVARMLIQVRSVVRTTSSRLMPSMPTLVVDAEERDPGHVLLELEAADVVRRDAGSVDLEAQHRDERERERHQRGAQRHGLDGAQVVARDEGQDEGADERREDDERQDGDARERDHQRVIRKMRPTAITMRPTAMPSA